MGVPPRGPVPVTAPAQIKDDECERGKARFRRDGCPGGCARGWIGSSGEPTRRAPPRPYLLQHADNPVDWWPWCDEAFAEARRRDVPVLISVGYAACHWCHVMAHESFEDEAVGALVNDDFVAIKVDREERPDVDAVYMTATQAMTGQGGWPMTVFATPDGTPFFCGTYFPRGATSSGCWSRSAPRGGTSARPCCSRAPRWSRRSAAPRPSAAPPRRSPPSCSTPPPTSWPRSTTRPTAASAARRSSRRTWTCCSCCGTTSAPATRRPGDRPAHRRGDGPGRHLRPARRRVRPLLGGRALDRAALREDALRQRAAAAGLHPAVAAHRRPAGRAGWPRETAAFLLDDLAPARGRASPPRWTPTPTAWRALTYAWTPAQLVEVLGEDDGRWAADLFDVTEAGTFEHGTSVLRLARDIDDADPEIRRRAGGACVAPAAAPPGTPAPSRPATTRWSPPGTAWRSPRSSSSPGRRDPGGPDDEAPTCWTASPSSPTGAAATPLTPGRAAPGRRPAAPGLPRRRRSASRPACWRTTAAWPRRSARCTSSPARDAGWSWPAACSTSRWPGSPTAGRRLLRHRRRRRTAGHPAGRPDRQRHPVGPVGDRGGAGRVRGADRGDPLPGGGRGGPVDGRADRRPARPVHRVRGHRRRGAALRAVRDRGGHRRPGRGPAGRRRAPARPTRRGGRGRPARPARRAAARRPAAGSTGGPPRTSAGVSSASAR